VTVSKAAREQLGAELKTLRKQAGLTLRQVEARVGVSNAAVSYWEHGRRLPGNNDLRRLLEALDATDEDRERILSIRSSVEDAPGLITAGAPNIGEQLARLIAYESAAERIHDVSPLLIPGLLQIGSYARAIMGDVPDAKTRVTLRAGRRDVLIRRNPVELVAFIDTEVLVRPVAPADVMIEQLHHLLDMGRRPNITIQLVSSTRPGWNPMLAGPFELLEFPEAKPIVHLEHHRSSLFLWEERDVRSFLEASETIRQAAMTPADSAGVIEDIVNGMETI
jgi:transcriptional regulator with XRE-family HTH domain